MARTRPVNYPEGSWVRMNATPTLGVAATVLALALAGCTGSFNVDQTEPFRVQLDGAPQTVVVREGGEPRQVDIQTCPETSDPCDVEEVDVKVRVQQTSSESCQIRVVVRLPSGEVLGERVITVGGDGSGSTATATGTMTGNGTGNQTTAPTGDASGDSGVVIENLVVNVRGNKNIVVVTQAISGSADVDVQAIKASGNANVDSGDGDSTATASSSVTMTNSTTTTTTGA